MLRLTAVITFFAISISLSGQFIQHNADTVLPVEYNRTDTTLNDSILVIFIPGPFGFSEPITITVFSPGERIDSIEWYSIEVTDAALEKNVIGKGDSLETNIGGGLQARIWKNNTDTCITRWAYFDTLKVQPRYEESCDELLIQGIEGGGSFSYFNPESPLNSYTVENGLIIDWKDYYQDENGEWHALDSLPFDSTTTDQYFPTPPIDYENYRFTVTVEDSLGHRGTGSVNYNAIAVEADFEASKNGIEISEDSLKFEAPLKLNFINKSLNAEIYQWTFFNDSGRVSDGEDKILRYSDFYEPLDSIKYQYPGYYDVKLKVEGRIFEQNGEEKKCVDALRKRLYVTVYNSFLGELPNVITPNNDGANDVFYFKNIEDWDYNDLDPPTDMPTTSIEQFEVYVYNRYGMRVYHYEGSHWGKQDAWNGKYNGSIVGSGVYFYVIKARGYDGRTFEQKGFFHVYSPK